MDTSDTQGRRPAGRVLHLGLGAFARAHMLDHTHRANLASPGHPDWAVVGFTGRSPAVADLLRSQNLRYHLIVRGDQDDRLTLIDDLEAVHSGSDQRAWAAAAGDPAVAVLTLTVTEQGYRLNPDGGLNLTDPQLRTDIGALRADPLAAAVTTAPARLAQAVLIRRARDAGPLTIVSCDNLPANGARTAGAIDTVLDAAGFPTADERQLSCVTTVVDRITPATTDADIDLVQRRTGILDRAPVVTEPFHDWVLSDTFVSPRPSWELAGARFVPDVEPYARRKLLLLNGAHSLLAYAGLLRSIDTVADAVADPRLSDLLTQWWDITGGQLPAELDVAGYVAALRRRFFNHRIEHRLAQIAADGSEKLRIRIVPVLLETLARSGEVPPVAAVALASWIGCWRIGHQQLRDPHAETLTSAAARPDSDAVPTMLAILDPALAADRRITSAVRAAL